MWGRQTNLGRPRKNVNWHVHRWMFPRTRSWGTNKKRKTFVKRLWDDISTGWNGVVTALRTKFTSSGVIQIRWSWNSMLSTTISKEIGEAVKVRNNFAKRSFYFSKWPYDRGQAHGFLECCKSVKKMEEGAHIETSHSRWFETIKDFRLNTHSFVRRSCRFWFKRFRRRRHSNTKTSQGKIHGEA